MLEPISNTTHSFPRPKEYILDQKIQIYDYTEGKMQAIVTSNSNINSKYCILLNGNPIIYSLIHKKDLCIQKVEEICFDKLFGHYTLTINSITTFYVSENDNLAHTHPNPNLSSIEAFQRFTLIKNSFPIREPSTGFYNNHARLIFSIENRKAIVHREIWNKIEKINFSIIELFSDGWTIQSEDKITVFTYKINHCEINSTKATKLLQASLTSHDVMQEYMKKIFEMHILKKLTRTKHTLSLQDCITFYNRYSLLFLGIKNEKIVLYRESLYKNQYQQPSFSIIQCNATGWTIQLASKDIFFHYRYYDNFCYINDEAATKVPPTSVQGSVTAHDIMQQCTHNIKKLFKIRASVNHKAIDISQLTKIPFYIQPLLTSDQSNEE